MDGTQDGCDFGRVQRSYSWNSLKLTEIYCILRLSTSEWGIYTIVWAPHPKVPHNIWQATCSIETVRLPLHGSGNAGQSHNVILLQLLHAVLNIQYIRNRRRISIDNIRWSICFLFIYACMCVQNPLFSQLSTPHHPPFSHPPHGRNNYKDTKP
jgi:hypothetical protein